MTQLSRRSPAGDIGVVDRQEPIAALERLCGAEPDAPVLMLWGTSGLGKSTLLQHLRHVLVPAIGGTCHVIDLERIVNYDAKAGSVAAVLWTRILDEIARMVESTHDCRLQHYWRAGQAATKQLRQVLDRAPDVRVDQRASRNSVINGVTVTVEADDVAARVAALQEVQRGELIKALVDSIHDIRIRRTAVTVLCFDTTERLHFIDVNRQFDGESAAAETASWLIIDLLPALLAAWPQLRVVLAGREPVATTDEVGLVSVELSSWEPQYTAELLRRHRIDPDGVADVVHRLCGGHPLWTTVVAEACAVENGAEPGTRLAMLTAVAAREPTFQWASRVLLGRLPRAIWEPVLAAAALRNVDRRAVVSMLGRSAGIFTDGPDWYDELSGYSFVSFVRGSDGSYVGRIHPLVRSALIRYTEENDPDRFLSFHARAAEYFGSKGSALEELYHRLRSGDPTASEQWREGLYSALRRYNIEESLRLVDLVLDGLLETSSSTIPLDLRVEAHVAAGQLSFYQARMEDARRELDEAVRLAAEAGLTTMEGHAQLRLAEVCHRCLDIDAATVAVRRAIEIFERLGDLAGQGEALRLHGHLKLARMGVVEAGAAARRSLELYTAVGDVLGQARAHELLSHVQLGQANIRAARVSASDALRLFEEVDDLRGMAAMQGLLADIDLLRGDLTSSSRYAEAALEIYRRTQDAFREAGAVHIFGRLHLAKGEYAEAEEDARRELAYHEHIGNKLGEANAELLLGAILYAVGRFAQAWESTQRAAELYDRVQNLLGRAHVTMLRGRLGLAAADGGASDEAPELLFGSALEMYRQVDNPLGVADANLALADCASRRNDLATAAPLAESALATFEDLGAQPGVGRALRLLGQIRRGQGVDAITYLRRAVETLSRTGPPDEQALAERALAAAQDD